MQRDRRPITVALACELVAVAFNEYPAAGAKGLWMMAALGIYWLIVREVPGWILFQSLVALVGAIVFSLGVRWLAIPYLVEGLLFLSVRHPVVRARPLVGQAGLRGGADYGQPVPCRM